MKLKIPANLFESFRWSGFLQFLAFGAVLFGIKLWLIKSYGNATPFWDQWDAEAATLYKPFLSGTLSLTSMFTCHCEHRIFTTRLLALALFTINSIWNPMLQMVVNAGLHIITLIFGISLLTRVIGRNHLPALLIFSLILFGIPYAWENTLAGFQAQFYFVVLFSIASLWLTAVQEPLTFGWWGGVACGMLAFFSLASGAFTLGAEAFVGLIVFFTNRQRTPKQLTAVAILATLFVVCIKFTPSIPAHDVYKAASFGQFYDALKGVLGWPISSGFFSALLRNLPSFIFTILIFKKPMRINDQKWFLLALIVWSFGQVLGIAYGRAIIHLSSRYKDLFAITILINFACLISIVQTNLSKWHNRSIAVVGIWTILVLLSLSRKGILRLPGELAYKRESSIREERNTRNYLATGDAGYLKNKPLFDIPYPDANRLAFLLSFPEIRKILPSNINPGLTPIAVEKNSGGAFVKNGYSPTTAKNIDATWGSYNIQGDMAMGVLSLRFEANVPVRRIVIPVAGYPMNDGIKLEIEQNGKRNPLIFISNPNESWDIAIAKVGSGQFSICASDSSKTAWLAIGQPLPAGRLDGLTYRCVSNYYMFLLLGFMIFIFLVISSGFKSSITNAVEPEATGI